MRPDACEAWIFSAADTTCYARGVGLLCVAAAHCASAVAEALEKETGYFRKNQYRMRYQEMREDGWAIGTGIVESGAEQFKARFTGPGMRWSRDGAESYYRRSSTGRERQEETLS